MKSFLINIKNLLPYLFLVCLYFIFINFEARKKYTNSTRENTGKNTINNKKSEINNANLRISIPVIPYND